MTEAPTGGSGQGGHGDWGPARSAEYRVLMAAITGVCALGAVAAAVPVVEHIIGAALIGAALTWVLVVVVRRELRIRRRLADTTGTRPARPRAGPGDHSPAPPAPNQPDPDRPNPDRPDPYGPPFTRTSRGGTTP